MKTSHFGKIHFVWIFTFLLLTSAGFLLQATLAAVFLSGGWLV